MRFPFFVGLLVKFPDAGFSECLRSLGCCVGGRGFEVCYFVGFLLIITAAS